MTTRALSHDDPLTAAVIVQFPPPARLTPLVQRITPAKDIDALLEDRSPHPACATADGITRLVMPRTTRPSRWSAHTDSSDAASSACWPNTS